LRELCGVAAAWNVEGAYWILHDLLQGLQHRGQESAGVVLEGFASVKGMGLVDSVITPSAAIDGSRGIGHVRYSTVGGSNPRNVQPITADTRKGTFSVAHNGTVTEARRWRDWLLEKGAVFFTDSDTEIFLHLISMAPFDDPVESCLWALSQVRCAYSILLFHDDFLLAARDGFGFRPLFWARLGEGYLVCSEDAPLKVVGASDIRELERGVALVLSRDGVAERRFADFPSRFCSFEYIYFARPDSSFMGLNVHVSRFRMGERLYRESLLEGDLVVPVLDSGISGALGFSFASGLPLDLGLMRNRYLGRSFIMPSGRKEAVRRKLLPIEDVVRGRSVIVVDDSIVRGTTMGTIVSMLREAGAREVSVAIHSPPVRCPCYYGIDTARGRELLASSMSPGEIASVVGADRVAYLSVEGLLEALGCSQVCTACFTGEYPHEGL